MWGRVLGVALLCLHDFLYTAKPHCSLGVPTYKISVDGWVGVEVHESYEIKITTKPNKEKETRGCVVEI